MAMDLSYLEQWLGDVPAASSGAGGVWVVSAGGTLDEALLRLIGKARVVANALGSYVHVLAGGDAPPDDLQGAIQAGADNVLTAQGTPDVAELADFFRERSPQVILFPRTRLGRALGPGVAQLLNGGLCAWAADVAVDPVYQRVVAHQPILDDAARQIVQILASPAVLVMDTTLLPAAFVETWRKGDIEDSGLVWPAATSPTAAELPATPLTLQNAPVVVAAGMGLNDEAGFALACKLAGRLGGGVAGDVTALDAGWITEEQLIGLTGYTIAPRLYVALGIAGDTNHLLALTGAGCIVAVQTDPTAAIVGVADYSIIADPAECAQALLLELG